MIIDFDTAECNQRCDEKDLEILESFNKEDFTDYLIDREDTIISMNDDNG